MTTRVPNALKTPLCLLFQKNKVKESEKTTVRIDAPSTSKDKPTLSKGKGKKK